MAATILDPLQCERLKVYRRRFNKYEKRGWMCEGSDLYGECNVIYNLSTDEIFWADYNGNILDDKDVKSTPRKDIEDMAKIQGLIRTV